MARFIKEDSLEEKKEMKTETKKPEKRIYIEKGNQKFVKCPKCGWIHDFDTKICRFCNSKV